MATFLITGASRGLGLALTKELVSLPASRVSKVFAASRTDSAELTQLAKDFPGRVHPVKLEVSDQTSIQNAAKEVETILGDGKGLDVLINNAGICQWVSSEGIKSMDNLDESMNVNVVAVHRVTAGFLDLLKRGEMKKVANISTTLGSITLARDMGVYPCPAYKISKAALNALTVQWALEYEKEGFTFMAVSPGWLKTELGGWDAADLTPEQGAKATLDIIFNKGQELNGKFPKVYIEGWETAGYSHVYDGTNAPW